MTNKRFSSAFSTDELVGGLVGAAHFAKHQLMLLRERQVVCIAKSEKELKRLSAACLTRMTKRSVW